MRRWLLIMGLIVGLPTAPPALAQEWATYTSAQDSFSINFPGQPQVTETIWKSEYGADLPARVYTATFGQGRYTVTVVDYNQSQPQLTAKAKLCRSDDERCNGYTSILGAGYWRQDVRGALVYTAWKLMQRDAKVTHYMWIDVGRVETNLMQLTNNADQSRTFASISMYDNKLYFVEGTVPGNYPPPALFQQSLTIRRDRARDEKTFAAIKNRVQYYNGAMLDDFLCRENGPNGPNGPDTGLCN